MVQISGGCEMTEPSTVFSTKTSQFQSVLTDVAITNASGTRLETEQGIQLCLDTLETVKKNHCCLYIMGNGGSAAVAAHMVNDFVNCGKIRAFALHDPSLLTCMANDYGYENAYARIVENQARPGDMLIAISSSGQSANICKAVDAIVGKGGQAITLSGFKADNPLRKKGVINLWLDAVDYGFVEIGHLFLLHHLLDRFKTEAASL